MVQSEVQRKSVAGLNKEARITALTLLKSSYDEGTFNLLAKEIYNPDAGISEAAITSSGSLGNDIAIPHLYQIIEKGRMPQRIAAVQALKGIRAPASAAMLVKYFNHFTEDDLRAEILRAINTISPTAQQVIELNGAVYADSRQSEAVKRIAAEAIVESERYQLLKDTLPRTLPGVQQAAFLKMLQTGGQEILELPRESLSAEALGAYLCMLTLKGTNAQAGPVLETLQKSDRRAITSFLKSLDVFQGRIRYPLRVFRLLLVSPYVDAEKEALVGDFLKKVVVEVKGATPQLLSEFSLMTSTHLETVFSKVHKNYITLRGISRKEDLLAAILATLMEKYATPVVLADVQGFFKDDATVVRTPPVAQIRSLLSGAAREDQNRFEACIPLFALREKKDRFPVFSQVSRVDLNRPFLVRRLNRLIRMAGALEIRTSGKKIQEILEFARTERIQFLEETSIVTLCQLLTRTVIEQSREYFHEPSTNIRSLNGYIRGARFMPPKVMTGQLVHIIQSAALTPPSRVLAVESLESLDLGGMLRTLIPLFKVFDMRHVPEPLMLRVGDILARYSDSSVGHQALDLTSHATVAGRRAAVRILKSLAVRGTGPSVENVTNRLYQLLEDPDRSVKVEAILALLAMADDYAAQIVSDYVRSGAVDTVVEIVAGITKPVSREAFGLLVDMIRMDSLPVQQALRRRLPELSQDFTEELRQGLLALLSAVPGDTLRPERVPAPETEVPVQGSVLEQKKLDFKFRRANAQTLTVFFIDIASFTEKSTTLDMSSLIVIVKAFEDIVGDAVDANRGEIVKKMGDGMLAVFKHHPLHAVAAALTVQKKIAEYSAMKVGPERFQARIGLNTGQVIRKDKDIFGEVVNVASRMQSSASPGEIWITDATFQHIRKYARCTELGPIQVKGIKDGILAYSPQEITVDLAKLAEAAGGGQPASGTLRDSSLEKLKESMFVPRFTLPSSKGGPSELPAALKGIFTDISRAIESIASDYHEEYEFKKYLQEKWDMLMERLQA
jgi:class 3 adenylate cyclase